MLNEHDASDDRHETNEAEPLERSAYDFNETDDAEDTRVALAAARADKARLERALNVTQRELQTVHEKHEEALRMLQEAAQTVVALRNGEEFQRAMVDSLRAELEQVRAERDAARLAGSLGGVQ
jgi:chromosome segregation ATPase